MTDRSETGSGSASANHGETKPLPPGFRMSERLELRLTPQCEPLAIELTEVVE